jgi:dTDP-4-dehydrorhamnose 3,5-epimerase
MVVYLTPGVRSAVGFELRPYSDDGAKSQGDVVIAGVAMRELTTHRDERGFFREIIRVTDDCFTEGFGQLSHSLMHQGVSKAWHVHAKQTDWWYVVSGVIKVALHDARSASRTYRETMDLLMGDEYPGVVLRIPPGVAHGCKCLSGPAHLLYVTSQVYDPADEGRIPHDDATIGYDWLKGPAVK